MGLGLRYRLLLGRSAAEPPPTLEPISVDQLPVEVLAKAGDAEIHADQFVVEVLYKRRLAVDWAASGTSDAISGGRGRLTNQAAAPLDPLYVDQLPVEVLAKADGTAIRVDQDVVEALWKGQHGPGVAQPVFIRADQLVIEVLYKPRSSVDWPLSGTSDAISGGRGAITLGGALALSGRSDAISGGRGAITLPTQWLLAGVSHAISGGRARATVGGDILLSGSSHAVSGGRARTACSLWTPAGDQPCEAWDDIAAACEGWNEEPGACAPWS